MQILSRNVRAQREGFIPYIAIMMSLAALLALCVLRKPFQSLWMFLVPQLRTMSVPSHWFQRSQASLYRRKLNLNLSIWLIRLWASSQSLFLPTYLLTCSQSIPGMQTKKMLSCLKLLLLNQFHTFVGSCPENTSGGWIHRLKSTYSIRMHHPLTTCVPQGEPWLSHQKTFLMTSLLASMERKADTQQKMSAQQMPSATMF